MLAQSVKQPSGLVFARVHRNDRHAYITTLACYACHARLVHRVCQSPNSSDYYSMIASTRCESGPEGRQAAALHHDTPSTCTCMLQAHMGSSSCSRPSKPSACKARDCVRRPEAFPCGIAQTSRTAYSGRGRGVMRGCPTAVEPSPSSHPTPAEPTLPFLPPPPGLLAAWRPPAAMPGHCATCVPFYTRPPDAAKPAGACMHRIR